MSRKRVREALYFKETKEAKRWPRTKRVARLKELDNQIERLEEEKSCLCKILNYCPVDNRVVPQDREVVCEKCKATHRNVTLLEKDALHCGKDHHICSTCMNYWRPAYSVNCMTCQFPLCPDMKHRVKHFGDWYCRRCDAEHRKKEEAEEDSSSSSSE